MICLTCDVHHSSLQTGNQKHCDISEIEVANIFSKMLEDRGIRSTFFISGRSFEEEWDSLSRLCQNPLMEIGGHTYNCFAPELWHRISKKAFGSYNGPGWYEKRDIQKTIDIIREKTGKTIRSWRNHMYMHGKNTDRILSECGIEICSDGVDNTNFRPRSTDSGILHLPINIIPDHEHLYHAERTPEYVAWWVKRYKWSDCFGSESYHVEDWARIVLDGLKKNEEAGRLSVVLVHPITLYLCDRFRAFEPILDFISQCETIQMGSLIPEERAKLA